MDLVWLGEPACHDRAVVGGKAAHLSRLAAGYRVPPGFCFTAAALAHALAGRSAWADEAPSPAALPPMLYGPLVAAYRTLAARCGTDAPAVAVRSSAVEEDGHAASFAGQYATVLNVSGSEAIAQAVLRCWASAQASSVRLYRRRQGLNSGCVELAILVQHMVATDVAAVVFSAHPLTGDRGEVVINASWGLGESIVGGTVTPDTYAVRKQTLTVRARQVADKRRMAVPVPGGSREVAVPRLLRAQPVLTDRQVVELTRLGMALEAWMGGPVDIECAYRAGNLYLLQCRPITALPDPQAAEHSRLSAL
jgi:pyruvate,water dikinase